MNQQTEKNPIDQFDQRTIYCRMLGHELPFKYCRSTVDGQFCRRIFDCWHTKIEIWRFVKTFFSEEEIRNIIHPPASKVQTLINLIEQSENRR